MSEEGKASLLHRFNGAGIRPRRLCTWGRKPGAVSGKRRRAAVFSLATARGLSSAWRTHGWRGDWPMGSARYCGSGPYCSGGRPVNPFPIIPRIIQLSNQLTIVKYEEGTSIAPKISKLLMVIYYLQMYNFHFLPNLQIPLDFELRNSREKPIWILFEF
jgi:hypothetical protein